MGGDWGAAGTITGEEILVDWAEMVAGGWRRVGSRPLS